MYRAACHVRPAERKQSAETKRINSALIAAAAAKMKNVGREGGTGKGEKKATSPDEKQVNEE